MFCLIIFSYSFWLTTYIVTVILTPGYANYSQIVFVFNHLAKNLWLIIAGKLRGGWTTLYLPIAENFKIRTVVSMINNKVSVLSLLRIYWRHKTKKGYLYWTNIPVLSSLHQKSFLKPGKTCPSCSKILPLKET